MRTTADKQRLWDKAELVLTTALVVAVIILALFASQTYVALCSFKGDLERRADELAFYLEQDPGPFPFEDLGLRIPRDDLERSLANQRETLGSLDMLWCAVPNPPPGR